MEQSNVFLMVRESSDQRNAVYRLGVNFQGEVTQWSMSPEEQIYLWNRHMYRPVYKEDNGERVIQIGFKKFTVDESCSRYEVDVWMATSIGQVLEPQEVDDKPRNVGEDIQRLTKLLQAGDISAEEFSLLIGQATGESGRQSENDAKKFKELEERADLAEYQGLWLAIFKTICH